MTDATPLGIKSQPLGFWVCVGFASMGALADGKGLLARREEASGYVVLLGKKIGGMPAQGHVERCQIVGPFLMSNRIHEIRNGVGTVPRQKWSAPPNPHSHPDSNRGYRIQSPGG